jgi:chemotaxis protein MotA
MGLIGTLIGLVQMLQNLEDTAAIGPAMSLALITTFYGALLSNIVFLPLAGKLRTRSREEVMMKQLTIEGLLCIRNKMNPRLTQECLFSFLPPESRIAHVG